MEKIIFEGFDVSSKCNLFHHGTPYDYLPRRDFEFHAGNLYGIIGEFGNGGAALCCGMTGSADYYEGKIYIDDQECSLDDIVKNSWYVGLDLNISKGLFKKKKTTVRQQIEYGVRNFNQEFDSETIQKIFRISNERIDRNIKYVSGERWKASAAIGFANGRKIFCYPWMNSWDIEHLKEHLSNMINFLTSADCIVIMPTTTVENIEKISSEYNIYNNNVKWW